MRTVRAFLLLLACSISVAGSGCHRKPTHRLKIAVTLFPIYDLTRRIAGPDADVVLLIVPGRPELSIQPVAAEENAVAGAGLAVRVGLGLDDWLVPVLDKVAPEARRIAVGDRVPTLVVKANSQAEMLKHMGIPEIDPSVAGKTDPYVWLDPQRAELIAKAITEEMARADVAHAADYRERSATLERSIEALDHEIDARAIGWKTRAFVPFRPAYAYFAHRYHLEVAGVLEPYPGQPPPIRYDQMLAKLVRGKGLAGVFSEPQFAPKSANIVGLAAKVPVGVLDALGGMNGVDSYEKLIRFDADALDPILKDAPRPPTPPTDGGAEAGPEL